MRRIRDIQADYDRTRQAVQAALIALSDRRREAASVRRELARARKARR